ncbi:MAG: circularly permuted type 2 ATP-grasp protein [Solirubrobacterales bacterium]|nr:circularly permuted type 2 ATP-grasp protein [Solirubrobacterales bacterium]
MTAVQPATTGYRISDYFDEAFLADGELRGPYRRLFDGVDGASLNEVQGQVQSSLSEAGVSFGPEGMRSAFVVDAIPRIITGAEWSGLVAGLKQRVRALQSFLADIYSRQEILSAGVIRRSILDGAPHYEPVAAGFGAPVLADIAGPDLVRDETGFRVLEDNLRFPSGLTFTLAARRAVAGRWPVEESLADAEGAFSMLAELLRAKSPDGVAEPGVAILSEGPDSAAWFEHQSLGRLLDIDVVTPRDLEVSSGRLVARKDDGLRPVDVLYNRSDTDRITRMGNGLTPLGELLIEPLRKGTLSCANSFGAGIADDKAVHCYTPEMIRFYLDEEPILPIPESYDLGNPEQASQAMGQLDRLVVKPRWALGGQDIVIGPRASARELEKVRHAVESNPGRFVAQEMIGLSTHPTLIGDQLEPRHIDLRPYVFTSGGEQTVAPLALTRFARAADNLVVSSTQGGGAKDTWILED